MKLQGVRVIDASQSLAGALVSRLMADHGAEVIKIEPPGGSILRTAGYALLSFADRGKRSVVLDLKQPEQQEAARQLIDTADVFVESLKPGAIARLGLDYATLSARNPKLVYVSVSGQGQTGPLRDVPAHDISVRAFAGALTVSPEGQLVPPDTSDGTIIGALHALAGVLMALYAAGRTGQGDQLDISLHDAALTLQAFNMDFEGHAPLLAFMTTYRTQDGRWVCLGGTEPAFVRAVFEGLGRPELIAPANDMANAAAQQQVHDELVAIFAARSQADWVAWFAHVRAAFAPVLTLQEALAHPQVAARGMLLHDAQGRRQLNSPIRFLRQPAQPTLALPVAGQDNTELLAPA